MKATANMLLVLLVVSRLSAIDAEAPTTASAPASSPVSRTAPAGDLLTWRTDYAQALADARRANQPILVRAGAAWCSWCKQLDAEMADPAAQKELRQWTLVYVDVDRLPKQAANLAIGPIPALRVLRPDGRIAGSRDGFMKADELVRWLAMQHATLTKKAVAATRPARTDKVDAELVKALILDLDRRDPAVRESAIRRLMLVPAAAAVPLTEALADGSLATRLAVLDVLQEWGAPVESIDPWQSETLAPQVAELQKWAAQAGKVAASRPAELTPAMLGRVQRDLSRLLQDDILASEENAIRERLARYGQALLPQVYRALEESTGDGAHERLTALRYRLVATDELVFAWPGGIERLAAMDVETRHRAAEDLVERAGPADEALLLELFSDPDGLVREISLRALYRVSGSKAGSALGRLLQDPEPNVRAAVLKQLAEQKSEAMLPRIAEYVTTEKDPDLLVHAIRVLRATGGAKAVDCLCSLLRHSNWQVRAEAAEALGEIVRSGTSLSSKIKKQISTCLVQLLDDSDGFVVSVAVKSIHNSELGDVTDALARAADKHPELASEVLAMLGDDADAGRKAVPHLRRFCAHSSAAVRAAAVAALCKAVPGEAKKEIAATLKDNDSRVRVAAATALLEIIQSQRRQTDDEASIHPQPVVYPSSSGGLLGFLFGVRRTRTVASRATTQPEFAAASAPATAASDGATPQSGPAPSKPSDDKWLVQFRQGVGRPKWLDEMVPAVEIMLSAEAPDERLIAAVVLLSFGKDEQVLPVVDTVLQQKPDLAGVASRALPWLLWDNRLSLFEKLIAMRPAQAVLVQIAQNMAVWPDARAAQPLWSQFSDPGLSVEAGSRLLEALLRVYFGEFIYSPNNASASRRERATADAITHVQSGPELQRVAALGILLGASLKDAGVQAGRIAADAQASSPLRADAFQVQLLSETRLGGQKLASAALAGDNVEQRRVAVRFLAEGPDAIRTIRNGALYLQVENPGLESNVGVQTGQPIKVTGPSGLKAEMVRPLLEDANPRIAAEAGYLLAVLKDPRGLDTLLRYWHEQAREDPAVRRMVYRAVTALDDDSQVALLEEIYRTFPKGDYWLRDFYWTIRSMTGPQVAELRRKIRDEVGMDDLR